MTIPRQFIYTWPSYKIVHNDLSSVDLHVNGWKPLGSCIEADDIDDARLFTRKARNPTPHMVCTT